MTEQTSPIVAPGTIDKQAGGDSTVLTVDDWQAEPDHNREVARLAELDQAAYEAERKSVAKALGFRTNVLDDLVKAARKENGAADNGEESPVNPLPEPWPDRVDGKVLLNNIVNDIRRYMVMSQQAVDVVALWVVHTHCFECFRITPRLHVTAPGSNCGKSTLLDVLYELTRNAVHADNLSTAVFFRLCDGYAPTLLIDEVDAFLKENEELRGAINAGHKRGGTFWRCEGDENKIRGFKVFAPAVLCGIGKIPLTLANRSFRIQLQKRLASEAIADFRDDRAGHLHDRAAQMVRWTRDHEIELRAAEPELPDDVINRLADNWRPLLVIADAAGGEWPGRARKALTYLKTEDDKESAKIKLLADMWAILDEKQADRLLTRDFIEALNGMEEASWSEFNKGKGINPSIIGKLLGGFEKQPGVPLKSRSIRGGDKCPKGYYRDDLASPYERYVKVWKRDLPPQGGKNAATPLQRRETAESQPILAATSENNVAARIAPNPAEKLDCSGVAAKKGGIPPITHISAENAQSGAEDIPEFLRRCTHCGAPAGADDPVQEVHSDNREAWLHRGCQMAWFGAHVSGEIDGGDDPVADDWDSEL